MALQLCKISEALLMIDFVHCFYDDDEHIILELKSLHMSQVAHLAMPELILVSVASSNWEYFYSPFRLDSICRPGWRDTLRVKSLVQEHNTVSLARS